ARHMCSTFSHKSFNRVNQQTMLYPRSAHTKPPPMKQLIPWGRQRVNISPSHRLYESETTLISFLWRSLRLPRETCT
ncbi:MAG: hypothetical protein AABY49_08335, partial [Planctomycetota bacterium]